MYTGLRKKQRGQIAKLKRMCHAIDRFKPFTQTQRIYEHFHVPGCLFIEHPKTREHIKNKFCQKWIATTKHFIENKPEDIGFCKVVCLICYPSYWSSQIIIFYDEKYYKDFWNRNSEFQKWEKITNGQSFSKKHCLHTELKEQGYKETIADNEFYSESEIWVYGEI